MRSSGFSVSTSTARSCRAGDFYFGR
jgi:hypothetical protein